MIWLLVAAFFVLGSKKTGGTQDFNKNLQPDPNDPGSQDFNKNLQPDPSDPGAGGPYVGSNIAGATAQAQPDPSTGKFNGTGGTTLNPGTGSVYNPVAGKGARSTVPGRGGGPGSAYLGNVPGAKK